MRAVIVLVLLFAAQVEAQTPGASDTQAGKEIWQGYLGLQNDCKLCHGEHGEGAFAKALAGHKLSAADFIRMAAIGSLNLKLVGTHAGVSIGEDGPSQMGLEDLAMMLAEPRSPATPSRRGG